MRFIKHKIRLALTIMELMIAIAVSSVIIFGISVVLADNQRGWNALYNSVNSDVVSESFAARKAFDSIIRKSTAYKVLLDSSGQWVEVYYYADSNSLGIDRYSRFYLSGNSLHIEHGDWYQAQTNPRVPTSTETLCSNVSSCVFKTAGSSVQMIMTLDNDSQTAYVFSSAVLHNH